MGRNLEGRQLVVDGMEEKKVSLKVTGGR